ncbi:hypothetical protein NDU88_003397 [Pleurodeles waltl]|uniref:Uncharacterized protein n=1 Tax=Pleurodeles waltl TaxID=8319 RepID=A0AAV7UD73_PLEWA|nr:hypothetical protein NDU88_003397 [Pleurodeles waltl]
MCAPYFTIPKETRRAAGAVCWYRAALELRRTRKNVARIPLRGNSGSCNIRAAGAAFEKRRPSEQPKENSETGTRSKTCREAARADFAVHARLRRFQLRSGNFSKKSPLALDSFLRGRPPEGIKKSFFSCENVKVAIADPSPPGHRPGCVYPDVSTVNRSVIRLRGVVCRECELQ